MNLKTNHKLPIALALILPGFNLLSNTMGIYTEFFLKRWLAGSIAIWTLWYLLLWISERFEKFRWLITIVCLLIGSFVLYWGLTLFIFGGDETKKLFFVIKYFSAAAIFLLIQHSISANSRLAELYVEKEKMQTENFKAQLNELKEKMEPHFLFNSLNTLRTMIHNSNPESEEFVMNLSHFYRQTLKVNSESVTKLNEELEIMNSYIFLMKTRNIGAVDFELNINPESKQMYLPVFGLQTLVENCFKHNRVSHQEALKIRIFTDEKNNIFVWNKKNPKFTITESSGFGLDSIKKRYELLGIDDGIEIRENEDEFEVRLKLLKNNMLN